MFSSDGPLLWSFPLFSLNDQRSRRSPAHSAETLPIVGRGDSSWHAPGRQVANGFGPRARQAGRASRGPTSLPGPARDNSGSSWVSQATWRSLEGQAWACARVWASTRCLPIGPQARWISPPEYASFLGGGGTNGPSQRSSTRSIVGQRFAVAHVAVTPSMIANRSLSTLQIWSHRGSSAAPLLKALAVP